MSTITVKDGTTIYYKDWGSGQPIVFSHGWPLSADDWDTQMLFFLKHGYRRSTRLCLQKWQRSGDLAATPAGAVYIVDVNATGGGSHPIRDGTDDKVPPLRGARQRRRSFVPDSI
jgi:hypothetical protein